jgi:hypothetical protein
MLLNEYFSMLRENSEKIGFFFNSRGGKEVCLELHGLKGWININI